MYTTTIGSNGNTSNATATPAGSSTQTTSTLAQTAQSIRANAVTLMGEVVAWEFPDGMKFRHTDIVAALTAAGFNPAVARGLHNRFAFVRAIRILDKRKLVEKVEEIDDTLTFQVTRKMMGAGIWNYNYEAKVSLDLTTGTVRATDPAIETAVTNEMAKCLANRTIQDVTRMLKGMFKKNKTLIFPTTQRGGHYFVSQIFASFIAQIETLVVSLGGEFPRIPVPDGTPQGNKTVANAVLEGILEKIEKYEADMRKLNTDSSKKAVEKAWKSVMEAQEMVAFYHGLLGPHAVMLEDHAAYVKKLFHDQTTAAAVAAVA
jgi:hypothetical protein